MAHMSRRNIGLIVALPMVLGIGTHLRLYVISLVVANLVMARRAPLAIFF